MLYSKNLPLFPPGVLQYLESCIPHWKSPSPVGRGSGRKEERILRSQTSHPPLIGIGNWALGFPLPQAKENWLSLGSCPHSVSRAGSDQLLGYLLFSLSPNTIFMMSFPCSNTFNDSPLSIGFLSSHKKPSLICPFPSILSPIWHPQVYFAVRSLILDSRHSIISYS